MAVMTMLGERGGAPGPSHWALLQRGGGGASCLPSTSHLALPQGGQGKDPAGLARSEGGR